MNDARKKALDHLEKADIELFQKIQNNPQPDVLDLWQLSEDRFVEWRKIHDFPKLLTHFDRVLKLFKEWKQANKLTNGIIIATGEITPFLERKKLSEDKTMYLLQQTNISEDLVRTISCYGEVKDHDEFKYQLVLKYIPYLDWLATIGETETILNINSRSAYKSDYEKVFIHADLYGDQSNYELLKMGGIEIPINGMGILFRGKRMEFVNLCALKLKGNVLFGELGNLHCCYCACDNWTAENFSMLSLDMEHCSVENFSLKNTEINSWRFYDCIVTGDFVNSKLTNVLIYGGRFQPLLKECTLIGVDIEQDKAIIDQNYYAYKTFKKIYQDQGDDETARRYFILENEYLRKGLKGLKWLTKTMSFLYWEYGSKPHRIIYLSLMIIITFAFVYWLNSDCISLNSSQLSRFSFMDSLYFSTTTFTTLGYGDVSPLYGLKILTSIEAFMGVINMGFLIAGYSNNKY